MTEQELKDLIRATVARHLAAASGAAVSPGSSPSPVHGETRALDHPSHDLYVTIVNTGEACVIEPGVACNHCGYCKSHGH